MCLDKAKMGVSLPQGTKVPLSGVQRACGAPVMVEALPELNRVVDFDRGISAVASGTRERRPAAAQAILNVSV